MMQRLGGRLGGSVGGGDLGGSRLLIDQLDISFGFANQMQLSPWKDSYFWFTFVISVVGEYSFY